MQMIARFEKVSFDQFLKDSKKLLYDYTEKDIARIYEGIELPQRATSGSAGYDFHTPYKVVLQPHDKVVIPSGIRCKIDDGYMMLGVVRSSIGIKSNVNLSNNCMVLDADYYHADNEGHIMIALRNMSDHMVYFDEGERIIQGVFLPYGITTNDTADKKRTGGIGSTNA